MPYYGTESYYNPSPPLVPRLDGLNGTGDVAARQAISTGVSVGVPAAMAAALGLSLTAPIVGAAVAGVTLLISVFLNRKRGQQKVATTYIVDEAEPYLKENLNAYMSSSRTMDEQAQSLANFDSIWAEVIRQCGQKEMGSPGQWCINDRKPGGKWDWFRGYRDPILNDPLVHEASITESLGISSGIIPSIDMTTLILIGGGLLLVLALTLGMKGRRTA